MTLGNTNSIDQANKSDVKFVLNWCGLGDARIENVNHSLVSARSFNGDHLDAYSIKVSSITVEELEKGNGNLGQWHRCDSLPVILSEAVQFVSISQEDIKWFPNEEELRTKNFYVYPWSIYCTGISPSGAELIFVNPSENIVYFISSKT